MGRWYITGDITTMKRISLLAAMVFLAIFVVACSKDDKTDNAGNTGYESLIVGKWNETTFNEPGYDSFIWEFTNDGYIIYGGSLDYKYRIDGSTLLMYEKDNGGNFTIDNNEWDIFTIVYLSDSHMTIHEKNTRETEHDGSVYQHTMEFERAR